MEMTLGKVNRWAQDSCSRWNKNQWSRKHNRKKYQRAAMRQYASPVHQKLISEYMAGAYEKNTYPWPYSAPTFADWPESDNPEDYSLISDQSGFVVKYATSYVAYKIFELTGSWPQRKIRRRYDAWDWLEFLEQAGYVDTTSEPLPGRHYVGVLLDNEHNRYSYRRGLVVWAEKIPATGGKIKVSTYFNKKHEIMEVGTEEYAWVEIINPKIMSKPKS